MMPAASLLPLRKSFTALHPLCDAAWDAFVPLVHPFDLARGDAFIRVGEGSHHMAFVESGLLRAYYLTPDGTEATTNFCAEGSWLFAFSAGLLGKPSRATIEALEPTRLLRFPLAPFRRLFKDFPEWSHIGRAMAEGYLIFQEHRIADLLTLDAADRYARFRESHGHIAPRLQRQQIAAYLGITREALSRLGKK